MNTPAPRRSAELLILLASAGWRRIGGLIAFGLVVWWIWASFTGPHIGHRTKHRGKLGPITLTTYSHSR